MMIFMPQVVVWIGPFCHDVIGCQNVKVAEVGQLWFWLLLFIHLLFVEECWFCLRSRMSRL